MRALILTSLFLIASPALADETTGTITAFDRIARIIVLNDMTIWQLEEATELSPDLVAGDAVKIVYVGGGDAGIASITSVLHDAG